MLFPLLGGGRGGAVVERVRGGGNWIGWDGFAAGEVDCLCCGDVGFCSPDSFYRILFTEVVGARVKTASSRGEYLESPDPFRGDGHLCGHDEKAFHALCVGVCGGLFDGRVLWRAMERMRRMCQRIP